MTDCLWPAAELLPHAGPALLLEDVIAITETGLSASVTIRPDSAFHQGNGVPAHVGMEYMAQTCGAFSGFLARRAGAAPRVGFILGTRHFAAACEWFADGDRLVVTCKLVYRDKEVGVFDCLIRSGDKVVATAQLIVAEPKNVAETLSCQGGTDDG